MTEVRGSARKLLPRRRWGNLAVALRVVPCVLSRLSFALPWQQAKLPSGAMRVVLQAYSLHLAQFFVPVVDQLRLLAPDVEIWFAILPHPHFPARARRELRELARERMSIDDERIQSWRSLAAAPADLVLCGDVFAELPRGGARSCLLLHGPGVASRMLRPRRFRRTIFDFDLVLANGSFDQRRLEHAIKQAGAETRVENVGLPILDGLLEPAVDRRSYLEGLGLDPERPTILFGPAWSGLATLEDRGFGYVRDTVEELSRLPANLLIKLHACSLNPAMAGGVSWIPWLQSVRSEGIGVDLDPGDLPALAHCDVLVTDHSSRALNVQALGKPVVLWDPLPLPDASWDRERTQLIRRASLVAASPIETSELCSLALADPSIGKSGIEASTEALSYFGHASVHAAQAVIRAATEAGGEASAVGVGDRSRLRRHRGSSV